MKEYTEEEKREHFRRALYNYEPILWLSHGEFGEQLRKADEGLSFPNSPKDILEYLGNIEPLGLTEFEKDWARHTTLKLIDEHGAKHMWDYRIKHKCELRYICHDLGL